MRRRLLVLLALAAVPLTVLAVFFVLPVSGMIERGLAHGGWAGVWSVLERPRVHRVLWFTLASATAGTVGALVLGVPAAFVTARLAFPGSRLLRGLLVVPFVLPTVVVGVAFRALFQTWLPALDGTWMGIVLALVFFNATVVVRTVGAAWRELDPRPAEAAAALGAGPTRVLRTILWPALRPAIVSSAVVAFLFCATAFGVVLVLGGLRYSTVETEIYLLTADLLDLQAAAALSLLQLAVVVALLAVAAFASRTSTTRRRPQPRRRPRPGDLPALLVTGVLLLLVVAPIGLLAVDSLRVGGHWSTANYRALQHVAAGLPVTATEALWHSLVTAVQATSVALVLGLLVTLIATRRPRGRAEAGLRRLVDGLVMLPLGVSAVTLGFGFLITLNHPPIDFRASWWLVPLAQALVAWPLVVRLLVPVLAGIDDRQREAAATLGAGPLRTLLTVDVAALRLPLATAAGLAMAVSLGEFGATAFLVRADQPTLPVLIYRLISHPGLSNYGMAVAASTLLAALTAGVVLAAEAVAERR